MSSLCNLLLYCEMGLLDSYFKRILRAMSTRSSGIVGSGGGKSLKCEGKAGKRLLLPVWIVFGVVKMTRAPLAGYRFGYRIHAELKAGKRNVYFSDSSAS